MSAPQTYGASLYDLAKDEGMSREILVDLEGIVSLFNEHPAYVKILDAPQIERDDLMEILNFRKSIVYITSGNVLKHMKSCIMRTIV